MTVVFVDGARVAESEARVSVFDRGFLFGDGVFEVLRTYGGAPFALTEHLERLDRSLAGLRIRPTFTRDQLTQEIRAAIAALGVEEAYVRVMVSRGQGALHLDPRRATGPTTRVVIAAPLLPLPAALYDGVAIATVQAHRPTDGTRAQGAKIAAYVANMLALLEAQDRGAYEAALTHDDGSISEGHSSSLFVVARGVLTTPPLATGALPGITRAVVMEEARLLGREVRERLLFTADFERADEAFLTSSLREVVPVTAIDGRRIGSGAPGPVTRLLGQRYRARARAVSVDGPDGVG